MRKIIACTAAALACALGAAAAREPVGAPEWRGFDLSLVAVSPAESGEPDSAACRIDGAGPTPPAPGDDAAASAFAARFGGARTKVLVGRRRRPARFDGKPVESWTTLKSGFHLTKEDAK
ncbi:MAG: hypothetical protein ABFD65_08360 [Candidatus Polarisedimenticolia bacterium]|nr:hypothetical protein [bacterium]